MTNWDRLWITLEGLLIGGGIGFLIAVFSFEFLDVDNDLGVLLIWLISGLIILRVWWGWRFKNNHIFFYWRALNTKNAVTDAYSAVQNFGYAQAEEEVESGQMDRDLWSKALVNSKGDEVRRKAEYIKLRSAELRKALRAEIRNELRAQSDE